ncbi:glycosyl hydrolase family 28-related protein [Daejeonella lutea]|uniref:Sugar lactone lactonase YvrE n=1 Tax=Daejeonella lutea TaxID=572036 RepID=A0A1T5F7G0_9SPHI|nr:glycosyl hydrolase family 28-related protein [Daejeonella lutea]SKB92105.1 Sugar lactone lactonase YvrE [Daejeonella lutea]
MKKLLPIIYLVFINAVCFAQKALVNPAPSTSFYTVMPVDPEAAYFSAENFDIKADGRTDVSDELQKAINQVKTIYNFGIVFIPEGKYLISKTIYVPQAIRIIGYGSKRPEIILASNSPGFQTPDQADKGKAKYMFWFTSGIVQPGRPVSDAGAGTFYSAMSNIDLRISDGNPAAVALRTHYAQHSFIAHVDIHIGKGLAGMFDVGNEMEDVRFFGGDYGIYTTKPSPGWQFVMVDTYFEGQRKAAVKTQEAGLTIIRMKVKNTPTVIETNRDFYEKLFMEDSQLENISGPAIIISNEGNAYTQISLRNVDCKNVPVLAKLRNSGKEFKQSAAIYKVENYNYGLQMDDLGSKPVYQVREEIIALASIPAAVKKDIPALPDMSTWVNIRALGAKGDGTTDDTKIIQDAIDQNIAVYIPQGWYRVTQTIKLKPKSVLIGLNPISTQFIITDNELAFGSFGPPKSLLETAVGGSTVVSGIGLFTGTSNPRAVACKWMAGADSYMNDVKFVGGHGTMSRPQPISGGSGQGAQRNSSTVLPGKDSLWDTQYWSLWITNNGGGTFKNIWTANTYATSGIYVSDTSTPGRIYAMSVEHHVRNEVRLKNVSNWKVYALQLEEESRESSDCQPMELEGCSNMVFANLYMFRVIRIGTPYPYSIRASNNKNVEFLNVHNYSQIKYTTNLPLYDVNSKIQVRPWEFNRLFISGSIDPGTKAEMVGEVKELVKGFEFADGITSDSKGNIYFSESRMRRIYRWSPQSKSLSLIADFPWEPLSLGTDKNDNLLVVFKYVPRAGYLVDGKPESFPNPPDAAGTSFSGWGNSGFGTLVYSINPNRPEESIKLLDKVPVQDLPKIYKTLNPANRRRDSGDFNKVSTNHFTHYFMAPDGVTAIPVVYDLARSNSLVEGYPGKSLYATDEYLKRTVKFNVGSEGYLSDPKIFAEKGEFSSAVDKDGNVYVADGQIYVYNPQGIQIGEIEVPERPSTIVFGGNDHQTLYITGRNSLYSVRIK